MTWKPGDVAMVPGVGLALRTDGGWVTQCGEVRTNANFGLFSKVSRVVVISPEDREQVERLTKVLVEAAFAHGNVVVSDQGIHPDTTAAALREFATPKPPRPEEPTAWLAAVEDEDGNRWCLLGGPPEMSRGWYSPDLNTRRNFADIAAVTVLSEGVQ